MPYFSAAILIAGAMVILFWVPFRLLAGTARRGFLMSMVSMALSLGVAVVGTLVSLEVAERLGLRDPEARKTFLLVVIVPYGVVTLVLFARAVHHLRTRIAEESRPPADEG